MRCYQPSPPEGPLLSPQQSQPWGAAEKEIRQPSVQPESITAMLRNWPWPSSGFRGKRSQSKCGCWLFRILRDWGAWVAQSVGCPTLAQVMISWFVGLSPTLSSLLLAQSLLQILCPPLSLPLPCSYSCCLKNKQTVLKKYTLIFFTFNSIYFNGGNHITST